MFRVKLKIDATVLQQFYKRVKTGIRGMGFVRTKRRHGMAGRPASQAAREMTEAVHRPRSRTYRTVTARRSRSTMSPIDIPARIMVGVIGPDGVGKSTLLALISGVTHHPERRGRRVRQATSPTQRTSRSIRGRIAYMPQGLGRNLYPTLSVFENIDFFGRLFGQAADERRARITELLTATALSPFEDRARPASSPAA